MSPLAKRDETAGKDGRLLVMMLPDHLSRMAASGKHPESTDFMVTCLPSNRRPHRQPQATPYWAPTKPPADFSEPLHKSHGIATQFAHIAGMKIDESHSALSPLATDVNGPAPCPVSRLTKPGALDGFMHEQKGKLIWLRDALIDSITLAGRAEATRSQAPGFSGDEADAGSAALEQEFLLQMLAQEHDALAEIGEALGRIERGVYGVCETCGKTIPRARLEAVPFARLDVGCQAQVERHRKCSESRALRVSFSVSSLWEEEAPFEGDSATPENPATSETFVPGMAS